MKGRSMGETREREAPTYERVEENEARKARGEGTGSEEMVEEEGKGGR